MAEAKSDERKLHQEVADLLDDFVKVKITRDGRQRGALEMRIESLVRLHIMQERARCFGIYSRASRRLLEEIMGVGEVSTALEIAAKQGLLAPSVESAARSNGKGKSN